MREMNLVALTSSLVGVFLQYKAATRNGMVHGGGQSSLL